MTAFGRKVTCGSGPRDQIGHPTDALQNQTHWCSIRLWENESEIQCGYTLLHTSMRSKCPMEEARFRTITSCRPTSKYRPLPTAPMAECEVRECSSFRSSVPEAEFS
ncbi:MAG: hypothetical protein DME65_10425 [Verrucomicrobia bacterium]|nr:MAG: hypothetical protein DME65_10425 [Verrucomicrobiota bacterium]